MTKKMYGENLEGNLTDLVGRMRRMAYRPGASREVLIPKPGRSAHDAVRDLHRHLYSHRVSTVIDVDLSRYFDSIDQQLLLEMIDKKVGDRRFLRYLCRQFKAGVLRDI